MSQSLASFELSWAVIGWPMVAAAVALFGVSFWPPFRRAALAGATIAAENGATEHQLMAIYGWASPKQAAVYTRKANRKKLTADAMRLVVPPGRSGYPTDVKSLKGNGK